MGFSNRSPRGNPALHGVGLMPHAHAVQFYENVEFLAGVVGGFVLEGLARGDAALLIAKRAHAAAFTRWLSANDVDVAEARRSGRVVILGAKDTLSRFMRGEMPDRESFDAVIGDAISKARLASRSGYVRAYGEMVDVLWEANNREPAIALEKLWNQLERRHQFSLLCSYSLAHFSHAEDTAQFQRICNEHSHVAPSESYVTRDAPGRLAEIALLQQRARSLESEIAHRTALAGELQIALEREQNARADAERARVEAEDARRFAEEANRVKSEFLAMMSHELRTPLNAIGGYTELVELGIHGPVTAAQREALDRVQRSKRMLLGLIEQVLNYARVETGVVRYEIADLRVDDVLAAAISLLAPQLSANGLEFRYDVRDPALTVRADYDKLQQVVVNLIGNAVKFTERGGTITLSVEDTPATVTIHVADTGIGIAPDRLDQIFQPFVQLDARYTRTRDGVGLGLAISREFATKMNGSLGVRSTPDEGSRFSLTLPRGSTP